MGREGVGEERNAEIRKLGESRKMKLGEWSRLETAGQDDRLGDRTHWIYVIMNGEETVNCQHERGFPEPTEEPNFVMKQTTGIAL